ncbi:hypothetical protein PM082_013824 [Marasmius tenuissimus]|nr:hypothetical protein PM082_013824 [Marasmius tenuissimus]
MAIDHTGIGVLSSRFAAVLAWYEAALKPLGYQKGLTVGDKGEIVGFSDVPTAGCHGHCDWWIAGCLPDGAETRQGHFAFVAKDRTAVDTFYTAAIAAGGKDNGPPGLREQYHPNYYAAFVFDPVGNNIEVVCHVPPQEN